MYILNIHIWTIHTQGIGGGESSRYSTFTADIVPIM